MSVERVKEFTIDLSEIVKTRLNSFTLSRKRIQATGEAVFQRRVVDEDLSWKDQLDYRKRQLKEEQEKTYPDLDFIDEIKTSISSLRKLVKAREFRDQYYAFLQELVTGKKTLADHLEYLQNTLEQGWNREIRDEIQDEILKVSEEKTRQDRMIIDSQISFKKDDRTAKSLDDAIALVNAQLGKPEIQRDDVLRTAYELQLRTLTKERLEVTIEDKMNWMVMNAVSEERANPSLWKLEVFAGFKDKGDLDLPVNVGGVRYDSEREFWATTLNNYILGDFVNEYVSENKKEATLMWNKLGILPDSYLENLVAKNQILRTHPELEIFPQIVTSAVQDTVINALNLASKSIIAQEYLATPDLATEANYQRAMQKYKNLETLFGADVSLSPDFQRLNTLLVQKRVHHTTEIAGELQSWMQNFQEREGRFPTTAEITEWLKVQAPAVVTEIEPEEMLEKRPEEIVKEQFVEPEVKAEIKPSADVPPVKDVVPKEEITIPRGATLSGLAQQYGTTVEELMRLNPQIKHPDRIFTGARLRLPEVKPEIKPDIKKDVKVDVPPVEVKPEVKVKPKAEEPKVEEPKIEPKIVTVKRGETLWDIAQRELGAGRRWKELKTPEGIAFTEETAKKLKVGQKLVLPLK
ncbi:MAG: LysM peptidoglycan-binding domain-containing protein [Candidatus Pacebacteria bacterium]|nr:LysM peptidoglycan-binding domain-containing protein [Candidatus Paceibacterota bacterium]